MRQQQNKETDAVMILELVYRELHALDCMYGLTDDKIRARELVCSALQLLSELQDMAESTTSVETSPVIITAHS